MTQARPEDPRPAGWPDQFEPAGAATGETTAPPGRPVEADANQPTDRVGTWRHPEQRAGTGRRHRTGFGRWRRSRPFWGGLLITLGGVWILLTEKAPLRAVVHFGMQGLAGYAIPIAMVLCGVLLWFNPAQRLFYSILAVLLSLGTWLTSNLGGFLIGMLLGIIGGSLAFAWSPRPAKPAPLGGPNNHH